MRTFIKRVAYTGYYFCYWLWRGVLLLPSLWQVFRLCAPRVTFFGGARLSLEDRYARDAHVLAKRCVDSGMSIITGGGGGIMEAAARGAQEAAPRCVSALGIGLEGLEEGRTPVAYKAFIRVKNLIERKWLMIHFSETCIVFPGGVGTYNELAEVLTLIDMEVLRHVPFILYGKEYWDPVLKWMKETGAARGLVAHDLLNYVVLVDDVDTAFAWIERACKKSGYAIKNNK